MDLRRWPDPTTAIRDELQDVFGGQKEFSASDFIARIAVRLPVLDGGHYRLLVEGALDSYRVATPRATRSYFNVAITRPLAPFSARRTTSGSNLGRMPASVAHSNVPTVETGKPLPMLFLRKEPEHVS